MKKAILFFLPVFFLSVCFTSCSKESAGDVPVLEEEIQDDDKSFFVCKINGEEYKSEGILAYAVDFDNTYNMYGLSSLNPDDMAMYVAVDSKLGVGTHPFNQDSYALIAPGDATAYATYWGDGSGEVTITEKTAKTVKGTFKFVAVSSDDVNDKWEVTDGAFEVTFR